MLSDFLESTNRETKLFKKINNFVLMLKHANIEAKF